VDPLAGAEVVRPAADLAHLVVSGQGPEPAPAPVAVDTALGHERPVPAGPQPREQCIALGGRSGPPVQVVQDVAGRRLDGRHRAQHSLRSGTGPAGADMIVAVMHVSSLISDAQVTQLDKQTTRFY